MTESFVETAKIFVDVEKSRVDEARNSSFYKNFSGFTGHLKRSSFIYLFCSSSSK